MDISLGLQLPLYAQLADCDPSKYVQARVTDGNDVPLLGSPAALLPIGPLGMYGNTDLIMPNTPFVVAQYVVYDDPAYTIISATAGAGIELFRLDS